jgi:protein-L-isoaspartate(D-aspartate) O-methyltransferase
MDTSGSSIADTADLRAALVETLKRKGALTDSRVEAAFRAIPRHLFLPDIDIERVYSDDAIPTKLQNGTPISSSSQPAIMAIMLEQLDARPGQRVLEIGAGTGYNAALLAHLVGQEGRVISIDIDEDIVEGARSHLASAGYERVQVVRGDGGLGWSEGAPYDRIILTVGAPDILPAWREQLRPGGRLVLPLGLRGPQVSVAFEQREGVLESVSVKPCGFMPLRGAFAAQEDVRTLGPGLTLIAEAAEAIEPGPVLAALLGPSEDVPVSVAVSAREAFDGLRLWLALHEPGYCMLAAHGDAVTGGPAPLLIRWSAESGASIGLVEGDALCLVTAAGPLSSWDEQEEVAPAPLIARCFPPGRALAARLASQIEAWDRAGRPGTGALSILAYPGSVPDAELPDGLHLRKRFSGLVLRFNGD